MCRDLCCQEDFPTATAYLCTDGALTVGPTLQTRGLSGSLEILGARRVLSWSSEANSPKLTWWSGTLDGWGPSASRPRRWTEKKGAAGGCCHCCPASKIVSHKKPVAGRVEVQRRGWLRSRRTRNGSSTSMQRLGSCESPRCFC